MIISFSGPAGSGKSTIAKMLSEKLGWPRYYIGGIRREKAKERGMTLAEYNKLGETDPSTDIEVDEYQKKLGRTKDNFIIEGRTSWYFIPHAIKIYLDVSPEVSARRIFDDLKKNENRNDGNDLKTIEDVKKNIMERQNSDNKRYKKYYGIDVYDRDNYDFVLDCSNLSIQESFEAVYGEKPYNYFMK